MSLPERINAIKVMTYDVAPIVEALEEMGTENIDLDDILLYIQDWVDEDFGGVRGLIYQDENGEEL